MNNFHAENVHKTIKNKKQVKSKSIISAPLKQRAKRYITIDYTRLNQ